MSLPARGEVRPGVSRNAVFTPGLGWEFLIRLMVLVVVALAFPVVFYADVYRFRVLADCMWHPSVHEIAGVCRPEGVAMRSLGTGINLPYRSVLSEYPPAALALVFPAGRWVGSIRLAELAFGIPMMMLELAALEVLRRAWPRRRRVITRWWSVVVLPVALLGWFRMDFLAVLAATVVLVGLEKGRRRGGWITVGWLVKLWPATLLAGSFVRRRWSEFVAATAGVVVATLIWIAWSPHGFTEFLRFRAGRGLQLESLPASLLFWKYHGYTAIESGSAVIGEGGYGWVGPAMIACLAVFGCACLVRAWKPDSDVVALCGALTLGFMLSSRILSPQYLLWVAPFVIVLAIRRKNLRIGMIGIVASWLTFGYLLGYFQLSKGNRPLMFLVFLRNMVLVWLLVELFLAIRPRSADAPADRLAQWFGRTGFGRWLRGA